MYVDAEVLLCFMEMVQFIQFATKSETKPKIVKASSTVDIVYDDDNVQSVPDEVTIEFDQRWKQLTFKKYIPIPKVVHSTDGCLKQIAFDLFSKYIVSGSEYEINISYKLRTQFMALMDDYSVWMNNDEMERKKILKMFDNVASEMYALLMYSFVRFKSLLGSKSTVIN